MKSQQYIDIVALIHEKTRSEFLHQRDDLREDAKQKICKVEKENRRTYNLRRKQAQKF